MSTEIGKIFCGDTDGIFFPVTPPSALVGATVTASLWVGPIDDPSFSVTKETGALTIDVEAGTVEVPITEEDWAGFPTGRRVTFTIELELRRDGEVRTFDHQYLIVKPQRIV